MSAHSEAMRAAVQRMRREGFSRPEVAAALGLTVRQVKYLEAKTTGEETT